MGPTVQVVRRALPALRGWFIYMHAIVPLYNASVLRAAANLAAKRRDGEWRGAAVAGLLVRPSHEGENADVDEGEYVIRRQPCPQGHAPACAHIAYAWRAHGMCVACAWHVHGMCMACT